MIYVGTYIWSMVAAIEVLCFLMCVCAATSWSYGKNCNIHEIMSILLAVLGYYSTKLI